MGVQIVTFVVETDDRDVDGQTKKINSLAAEGWEYVGLVSAGPYPYSIVNGNCVKSGCNVLFKRPKR